MSESPASQAQSSNPPINGIADPDVETINGVLQENMTKLQEAVVSTTYSISVPRIVECLFGHNMMVLILPINY